MTIPPFTRKPDGHYVLGIDLGSASVGLALLETNSGEIVHTSVRVFPAGMTGSENDWENGKEVSNAAQRRLARGQRRQSERRKRRIKKVFHLLRSYGWLPDVSGTSIQPALNTLDKSLADKHGEHKLLPYFLRARGLDHKLDLMEFGRAIYHLAQRRGFLSNRKTIPKDDEDSGVVYAGIDSIRSEIKANGKRTLGEYFASLDPAAQKVRRNWTHRDMFVQEFALLWAAQQHFYPEELSSLRQDAVFNAIFFQRPLKDQSNLVGHCDLEPTERRAAMRLLAVQKYRYLTALNNLRLYDSKQTERLISPAERAQVLTRLDVSAKLTFAEIRKILGVKNSFRFSIEEGGEKQIPGNATASRIYEIAPAFWMQLNEAAKTDLVEDIGDGERFPTDEGVDQCLREKWGLSKEEADAMSRIRLPAEYASLSLKAIQAILPLLEAGATYAAAKHQLYPEIDKVPIVNALPPVKAVFREIRNPAVLRSLTEMRKCVNAYLRHFGKPDAVHVELARELRRSKGERSDMTKLNRDNEKARERAKADLAVKGLSNPSPNDIEKYLLWEECRHTCPYSGLAISFESIFVEPRFEIEHIIPYSRSLDNGRVNKTLCHVDYNREKRNKTPVEAFGSRDDWPEMVKRMGSFAKAAKLKRFLMTETDTEVMLTDFSARQLTDTKYASKLAAKYLSSLYGGKSDGTGMRIVTCAGAITAALRRVWDMNRVLNTVPHKSRDDHRHHAVDAVAIALCSMKWIRALSVASQNTRNPQPLRSALLADPWPGFRDELRTRILDQTRVGHRPMRKLGGALHEETIYSRPQIYNGGEVVHIRKPVTELKSESDVAAIVDAAIREAVLQKHREHGGDSKKFAQDPPRMKSGMPIKSARVRKSGATVVIGNGPSERRVISGSNHHMELLATLNTDGAVNGFKSVVVSHLEANLRNQHGLPVVQRDHGPGHKFLFSLSEGDMVEYKSMGAPVRLCRVRGVSNQGSGLIIMSEATDARLKKEISDAKALFRPAAPVFLRAGGRKVRVDQLGNLVVAND